LAYDYYRAHGARGGNTMKTKNIIRKATTLAAGTLLVGATLSGAVAYDLSTYPDKFLTPQGFDGTIIVGEHAATADVIGSIDIAASLQHSQLGTIQDLPDELPTVEVSTGADRLELRESLGEVMDTITESDLPGLKSGRITTSEGTTTYNQYLRFRDGTNLQEMAVNFIQNDDDEMSDYLVIDKDKPFFEWEIQFPQGLKSDRDSNGRLSDMEDRSMNIMGQDFTIVKAEVDSDGRNFEMVLMGGAASDALREGQTRVYEISGIDYEVTVLAVSNPRSSGVPQVKFSVNGEQTQALREGDTETLSGGFQIGVRDILVNNRDSIVSFSLGADRIVITDSTTAVTNDFNGDIKIDNTNINDGEITVLGSFEPSGTFRLSSIKYRLTMDAEDGSIAYIPQGHGVREFMRRPQSLISDQLYIGYQGLTEVETTSLSINAKSSDRYELAFTNIQGRTYRFPLVSNRNGVWRYGDDNYNLVFAEPPNGSQHNVQNKDYVILSNARGSNDADKSVTNILRYRDYEDSTRTLEFEDLSNGNMLKVPVTVNGIGRIVVGGHTYMVNVSDVSAKHPQLAIDHDADGSIEADVVKVTAFGGVIIDLAKNVNVSSQTVSSSDGTALTQYIGAGNNLNGTSVGQGIQMSATVLAKNFDTSASNEELTWTISRRQNNRVDLSLRESDYTGPLTGNIVGPAGEFHFDEPTRTDNNKEVGMTDWGILVTKKDNSNNADELILDIPKEQRLAQVFVTLGTPQVVKPKSEPVNPIGVGMAVLDSDALALGSTNMIVIGGPCANSVAAELLGNPANCAEGFKEGHAMIRTWDKNGKVAMLVAGYEAQDTLGASRVLARWDEYNMKGTSVEIVVPDLSNIIVRPTT